ncbi:MAG TPA: hypothetical protein VMS74_04235, partial [Acidimicrobiia bacterium]|nr:hypothetical protein [Acidimicrobiia bacterium]
APACQACKTANTQKDLAYRYRKGLLKGQPTDEAITDLLSRMEAKVAEKKSPARRTTAKKASSG